MHINYYSQKRNEGEIEDGFLKMPPSRVPSEGINQKNITIELLT